MDKVKKAPAIRFRAYNRDWRQLSLDQHASFLKGKGYKKEDLKSSGQEIILYGKMYTDYKTAYTKSDTFVNLQQGSVLSQAGDVIVPASGETAEEISIASAILKDNIILGGDINIIRPTGDLDPIFLALSISTGSVKNELTKMAEGATIAHLRNNNLKKVTVVAPHLEEQTQIGSFFKNLDEKLELEKEKYEKLKNFKKAMLEDMFPKEGGKVPKVRLEGFDDEWEEVPLCNVLTLQHGYAFESSFHKQMSKYKIITIKNVTGSRYVNHLNTDTVEEIPENILSYQLLKKGDILISLTGNIGRTSIVNADNCLLNQRVGLLDINYLDNKDFVFYSLKTYRFLNYLNNNAKGSSQSNVGKQEINKFLLLKPSPKEQALIGNFFKNLDERIALSEKKIAKIENFKKAMLEKMFV